MRAPGTVSILGAGAMGAVYASRFYAMNPACVSVVAQGERYERLRRDGLIVNGKHVAVPVLAPEDTAPPSDLILVALKHRDLAASLDLLQNRVGDNTVILSVMNGLDSEAIIRAAYDDRVLYAVSVGIDAQRQGNVVSYSKIGTVVFGEADNTALTERVLRVQDLLERASIPYETPVDMIRMMWWKFMINVGINQASAVLRAPYGVFHTSRHAQAIMEAAMREVIAIAQATGVNLTPEDLINWYPIMRSLHPQGRTSMLQDIEAGRETEVDVFAAKIVALGLQTGVPTPVNEILLHAIKVIEQCPQ